jgi:hypothetical protein
MARRDRKDMTDEEKLEYLGEAVESLLGTCAQLGGQIRRRRWPPPSRGFDALWTEIIGKRKGAFAGRHFLTQGVEFQRSTLQTIAIHCAAGNTSLRAAKILFVSWQHDGGRDERRFHQAKARLDRSG